MSVTKDVPRSSLTSDVLTADSARARLQEVADPEKARILSRFFKAGPGEYAEGDQFLGVSVPESRKIAHAGRSLPWPEVKNLLHSPIHEERLVALLILVDQFKQAKNEDERARLFELYATNLRYVNHWDLVDTSAPKIAGAYLLDKNKAPLYEWAASADLWVRRVAIMATFAFIKRGRYTDTLRIARILRDDSEDLIHKAVGWMLREVGNRNRWIEERFLQEHYRKMPRTMLRYAIEKLPAKRRQAYLNDRI